MLPCPGEIVSGDRAIIQTFGDILHVALVDVAGHGRRAAQIVEGLDQHMRQQGDLPATSWLYAAHQYLIGSSGAVGTVLRLDLSRGIGEIAGVGNVRCSWFGAAAQSHVPNAGLLGVTLPRVETRPVQWHSGVLFALMTDGVRSEGWNALHREHSKHSCDGLVVQLTKRYQRRHDDAIAVCIRLERDWSAGGVHVAG